MLRGTGGAAHTWGPHQPGRVRSSYQQLTGFPLSWPGGVPPRTQRKGVSPGAALCGKGRFLPRDSGLKSSFMSLAGLLASFKLTVQARPASWTARFLHPRGGPSCPQG